MGIQSLPQGRGSRSLNRLRLGAQANIVLTHESRRCLIDDISMTGARLRIERALAVGQTAVLQFHELKLYAAVVWVRGTECGLRFDQPLELEDMQGMLWITQNRDVYNRICQTGHAMDWSEGL